MKIIIKIAIVLLSITTIFSRNRRTNNKSERKNHRRNKAVNCEQECSLQDFIVKKYCIGLHNSCWGKNKQSCKAQSECSFLGIGSVGLCVSKINACHEQCSIMGNKCVTSATNVLNHIGDAAKDTWQKVTSMFSRRRNRLN